MEEQRFIFEGKTTNEAIENGLRELKTTKNNVEIKVLEDEDKKTFFSILAPKVVKVEMKLKNNIESQRETKSIDEIYEDIQKFVKNFVSNLPTKDIKYEISKENQTIKIDINDERASYLIGYRGETMNSLQNIITNIASRESLSKVKIQLNVGNYRQKREEDLKILANKIVDSVVEKGKPVTLEPMNAYDRKVIHTQLQNHEKVKTYSVGKEPFRKVVISLK